MVNSENRKKQVNVMTGEFNRMKHAASHQSEGPVCFKHPQPLRLNLVGEECRRGRSERREPGLSRSSRSENVEVVRHYSSFPGNFFFQTNAILSKF